MDKSLFLYFSNIIINYIPTVYRSYWTDRIVVVIRVETTVVPVPQVVVVNVAVVVHIACVEVPVGCTVPVKEAS